MRTFFAFCFYLLVTSALHAQSWQWADRFGGASDNGSNHDEWLRGVVTDPQGNVYVTGNSYPGADIGGTIVMPHPYDTYLAKYDLSGNLLWVRFAGNNHTENEGWGITLDKIGHIYLSGDIFATSSNNCNFFGSVISTINVNMFVAKLDTSGNLIWVKTGAPGNQFTGGWGIKINIDSKGMINVMGRSNSTPSLFPGYNFPGWEYVARFDTSGNIDRFTTITPTQGCADKDYKISSIGDQYVTGYFSSDSVIIGTQTLYRIGGLGLEDLFFAKFDSAGAFQWVKQMGGSSFIGGYGISIDQDNNVYLTGNTTNVTTLDGHSFNNSLQPASNQDFPFVAKFNAEGQLLWATNLEVSFFGKPTGGLTVLPNGNVLLGGWFRGVMHAGDSIFNSTSNGGLQEHFISEISASGTVLWGTKLQTTGDGDEPQCITNDLYGNIFLGGAYDGTMTCGSSVLPYGGGNTDGFIAKWNSGNTNLITISANPLNDSICQGSNATFSVNATGTGLTYHWQLSTNGCATWNDLMDTAYYSGTGTNTLVITNAANSLNNYRYHCLINGTSSAEVVTLAATLIIYPLPAASAGIDTTICLGTSATLNASGGVSYLWSPTILLSDSVSANPVANITTTTSFTVTVTDIHTCTASDAVIVSISPLANAGADTTICHGSSATLHASPGSVFHWSPVSEVSDSAISNPTTSPNTTESFTVAITDGIGCVSNDAVMVTVLPTPIANAGIDTITCANKPIQLQANGGVSFSWNPTTGLNNPNSQTPIANPAATTSYTVTVTGVNGCIASDAMVLTVDSCTGINETDDSQLSINIYPNPTTGKFSISSLEKIETIEIYNVLGEKVFSQECSSIKNEIDLSKEAKGIYFLRVGMKGEFIARKIILE